MPGARRRWGRRWRPAARPASSGAARWNALAAWGLPVSPYTEILANFEEIDDYLRPFTDPIKEVTTSGIITADGVSREVDAIVIGTGFHVTDSPTFEHIIGKDGRTAQAIRTLLSAATSRSGRRVQLDIVD